MKKFYGLFLIGFRIFFSSFLKVVSFAIISWEIFKIVGYFSSGDSLIPGNFGLKDQVAALKWIQNNINRFGGDKNSVTVLGHNSGAACAHLHTVSALSKGNWTHVEDGFICYQFFNHLTWAGLFHRVIIESGNAIKYFIQEPLQDIKATFVEALEKTSCNRSNIDESVACLKSTSADILNKVVNAIPVTKIYTYSLLGTSIYK